jgi:DNA-binding MarR family transcriptional regulator
LTSRSSSSKIRAVPKQEPPRRDHVDDFLDTLDVPGLDPAVEGIVDRIVGLHRRFRRNLEDTITEHGLNAGEYWTMTALQQAGPPYRRSPGFLAARAELSSGAMTNRLDRLEERHLIRRLPNPDDRRGVVVELTPDGLELVLRALATTAQRESVIASALSDREKEQLNDLLRRLMVRFEDQERVRGER